MQPPPGAGWSGGRLPPVIGHRGAAGHAPENTAAGLRHAARLGIGWVEVDVALTGGGRPVLLHDETLDRTTTGRGPLAMAADDAVAALDAGGWFGAGFAGEAVPTLAEALRLCARLGLGIDLEIKPTPGSDRETAEAMVAVLDAVRADTGGRPAAFCSSFSVASLAAARQAAPDLPRGLLVHDRGADWTAAAALECFCVLANADIIEASFAAAVRAAGFQLGSYTVNDREQACRLRAVGVDCLISDWPDRIK